MEDVFTCSIIHNGILGGGLYLKDDVIRYRTQKLTVDKKYRDLKLPIKEIKSLTWKNVIFPIATFTMHNGDEYKFIIFNKNRFCECYNKCKV